MLPTLQGNWIDLLIITMLAFAIWEGTERGLILGIIDLLGFLLAFVLALKLYPLAGQFLLANFSLSRGIANALGFLLLGFLTQALYSLAVNFCYRRLPRKYLLAYWNRSLGFIPSLGSGVIFASFILTLFIGLPVRGRVKADILGSRLGSVMVRQTQGVERDLKKIFGEAVNETLTFLTINPQSQEYVDLHFTEKNLTVSVAAEQTMLVLISEERNKQGLGKLHLDSKLRDVARSQARDMFERGYFAHYTLEGKSPFDRMEAAGITYQAAGENLALAPSVQLAHQGLMNSEGHRKNILSADFGKVGIGAIDGGIYGIMFVQEFTD